jgi:hypothetical protein
MPVLRNWSPLDFRIGIKNGDLPVQGAGAKARFLDGNVFLLTSLNENFRCSVDGFDQDRDLFVRVDEVAKREESGS